MNVINKSSESDCNLTPINLRTKEDPVKGLWESLNKTPLSFYLKKALISPKLSEQIMHFFSWPVGRHM